MLAATFLLRATPLPAATHPVTNAPIVTISASPTLISEGATATFTIRISPITVPGGTSLSINNVNNTADDNYIEIWVTGKLTTAGSGYITQNALVKATWYIGGNISLSGGAYQNQSGLASSLAIYGYGSVGNTATVSGSGSLIGTMYAPTYATTLSGTGSWCGALVTNTFTISGGTSLHYDEALSVPYPCSGAVTVVEDSDLFTPGNCTGNYTEAKTWHAVDGCGNATAPVSQAIKVADTTPPTIGQPGADAVIDCAATPNFTAPTASDTCSAASVVQTTDTTTMIDANTTIYQRCWQAFDACANQSASVCQTITGLCSPTPTPTPAGP